MTDWPEDEGPDWSQQQDNEARRWHEEVAKRLAKCEADLRVMREWPEYQPETEKRHEPDSERHAEHI